MKPNITIMNTANTAATAEAQRKVFERINWSWRIDPAGLVFVPLPIARKRRWLRLFLRSQNEPGAPDIVNQLGFPWAVDFVP
jgi:hypothetical protein